MITVKNTLPRIVSDGKYGFLPYQDHTVLDEPEDYILPEGIVKVKSVVKESPKKVNKPINKIEKKEDN